MPAHKVYKFEFRTTAKQGEFEGFNLRYIYRFRGKDNRRYIVYIEQYKDFHLYAVKFFPKVHSSSPFRYNIRTELNDSRNIYVTIVKIMQHFLGCFDSNASFFYAAAPSPPCEGYWDNRKFRFYLRMSYDMISPQNWLIEYRKDVSSVIMINRKKADENPELKEQIKNALEFSRLENALFSEVSICNGCNTACKRYKQSIIRRRDLEEPIGPT